MVALCITFLLFFHNFTYLLFVCGYFFPSVVGLKPRSAPSLSYLANLPLFVWREGLTKLPKESLKFLLPQALSAEITSVHHYTWLLFFILRQSFSLRYKYFLFNNCSDLGATAQSYYPLLSLKTHLLKILFVQFCTSC